MWVYSSAVERLTADQQVPGSNPGAPFFSMKYPERNLGFEDLNEESSVDYKPDIAQLVERSTVEFAVIEWSLVRFRVSGVLLFSRRSLR